MQRLPGAPDTGERFDSRATFKDPRAPSPVNWWAAANAAAVTVLAMDFATGYLETVSLPVDGSAVRLFPEGMAVREPMLWNISAVAFDFSYRSGIRYNDGQPAWRVPAGRVWTKYGHSVESGAGVATLVADNADAQAASATAIDLLTLARLALFNGATWDDARTSQALEAGSSVGIMAQHDVKGAVVAAATVATQVLSSLLTIAVNAVRQVSAVATPNVVIMDLRNLVTSLDIDSLCSGAGTATLQVEVSVNGADFIALEAPIAAAARISKHYGANVVGGTIGLSPLGFRYVRITAGSAGAGNTTTLTVSAK